MNETKPTCCWNEAAPYRPPNAMTKDRLERIKGDWYASVERRDHIRELWLALEQSWAERDEAKKKLELKEIELP